MIAPSNRLLLLVLVCVFPAALIGGTLPVMLAPAASVAGLAFLLALADLAYSTGRLDGVQVRLPDLVRFTKDEAGSITAGVSGTMGRMNSVIVGLALPRHFETESDMLQARLPQEPDREIPLEFRAVPTRRGDYCLRECWLEGRSPVGLWRIRARRETPCRIRVYPNLATERKALAAHFLNRGALGFHVRRQVGKGHEFEKLREYVPGDSYEDLHWKATARRARPITKVFQVERTQEVYVVLDASRLSAREVDDPGADCRASEPDSRPALIPLLDRYIRISLVLGLVAERQGDRYGLVTFSDRVHSFIRAGAGKGHYGVCRDALYTLEPRRVAPDYDELFRSLRSRLSRRSLLVFLTHLDDASLAESFAHGIDLISGKHVILVNMLAPPGTAPLFSGSTAASTEDVYRRLAGHLAWEGMRQLEAELQVRGIRLKTLTSERMAPEIVGQYLEIKQRQLL